MPCIAGVVYCNHAALLGVLHGRPRTSQRSTPHRHRMCTVTHGFAIPQCHSLFPVPPPYIATSLLATEILYIGCHQIWISSTELTHANAVAQPGPTNPSPATLP